MLESRVGEVSEHDSIIQNVLLKHTLKYLANESGFKNKSTFYSSFKRLEGQTPNQYIQNLKTLNNHE